MGWTARNFRSELISEGSSTVVRVAGEVDINTASSLLAALELASAEGTRVVADMRQVTSIDAAGVNALLVGSSVVRANRSELVVRNLSATACQMFDVLSLHGHLPTEAEIYLQPFDRAGRRIPDDHENPQGDEPGAAGVGCGQIKKLPARFL